MELTEFAHAIEALSKAISYFNEEVTRPYSRPCDIEFYRGRLMAIKDLIENLENVSIIFVHRTVNDFNSPIMDYEMYDLETKGRMI